jgi:hypothetical protein
MLKDIYILLKGLESKINGVVRVFIHIDNAECIRFSVNWSEGFTASEGYNILDLTQSYLLDEDFTKMFVAKMNKYYRDQIYKDVQHT